MLRVATGACVMVMGLAACFVLAATTACGRTANDRAPEPSVGGQGATGGQGAAIGGMANGGGIAGSGGGGNGSGTGGTYEFPAGTDEDAAAWYLAGRARGEALCRCALPDLEYLDSCIDAETFAPNPVCLSALAPPNPTRWRCTADRLAEAAECYSAGECSNGTVPPCVSDGPCPEPSTFVHAERLCQSRVCEDGAGDRVHARQLCDGVLDCLDQVDELNCTPGLGAFVCTNGQTVPIVKVCNTTDDCGDYSDERDCF